MKRLFVISLLLITLANCGFHLRGFGDLPPWLNNLVIIIQEAHHDLKPLLREQLESFKIRVEDDPSRASYLLIIERDNFYQQITNVSASTTPRQYQLFYDVQFTLKEGHGRVLIPSRHAFITRQLTINNDRVLGSDAEETLLKNEMRREAAIQIINQISQSTVSLQKK